MLSSSRDRISVYVYWDNPLQAIESKGELMCFYILLMFFLERNARFECLVVHSVLEAKIKMEQLKHYFSDSKLENIDTYSCYHLYFSLPLFFWGNYVSFKFRQCFQSTGSYLTSYCISEGFRTLAYKTRIVLLNCLHALKSVYMYFT